MQCINSSTCEEEEEVTLIQKTTALYCNIMGLPSPNKGVKLYKSMRKRSYCSLHLWPQLTLSWWVYGLNIFKSFWIHVYFVNVIHVCHVTATLSTQRPSVSEAYVQSVKAHLRFHKHDFSFSLCSINMTDSLTVAATQPVIHTVCNHWT